MIPRIVWHDIALSNLKIGDYVCCKDELRNRKSWYFTKPYKILGFRWFQEKQLAILDKDIPGISFPDSKEISVDYLKIHPIIDRKRKIKRILNDALV